MMHALDTGDIARKYKIARYLPDRLIEALLLRMSPRHISDITGVRSITGAETEGWFVGCMLTSRQFIELDERVTVRKIVESAQLAQEMGADIIGLGAFTVTAALTWRAKWTSQSPPATAIPSPPPSRARSKPPP
jgi:predicted amino acid dehydrogenase